MNMIFSNETIKGMPREFEFGKIYQIALGEKGRGRKLLTLTCPEGCEIKEGLNQTLTISQTKSGKWRIINAQRDNNIYLLLSTEGGYTRRGDGRVYSLKGNDATYTVLDRGNGADGDAGRIGDWDVLLIKVEGQPQGDWIRIRRSGGGYGTDPHFVYISSKGVFLFKSIDEMQIFCDELDIPSPNPEYDENVWDRL